jgi:hypothetical protein
VTLFCTFVGDFDHVEKKSALELRCTFAYFGTLLLLANQKSSDAKKVEPKLRVPKVAYCCFSMGQISPFYGVKQLKVS